MKRFVSFCCGISILLLFSFVDLQAQQVNENMISEKVENSSNQETTPVDMQAGTVEGVSVADFGAVGDGITDDTDAIEKALNSGEPILYFEEKEYKCTHAITMNTDNITVSGNGATLFTDNDFTGKDGAWTEWFLRIEADNVSMDGINIETRETEKQRYKTQVGVMDASHIVVTNCDFLIPDTVLSQSEDATAKSRLEYVNVDLYTGWHDVEIKNCTLVVKADTARGCCVLFRDICSKGAGDAVFENNVCYSNCKDEIFSVYAEDNEKSYMYNITIRGNEFQDVQGSYSRQVSATVGKYDTKNVLVEGNTFKSTADYAFMKFEKDSEDIVVRDNTIYFTDMGNEATMFILSGGTHLQNQCMQVKENNIYVDEKGVSMVACGRFSFEKNAVECEGNIRSAIFNEEVKATDNTVKITGTCASVAKKPYEITGNQIELNGEIYGNFFDLTNTSIKNDILIKGNEISYQAASFGEKYLLTINDSRLNGYVLNFSDNTLCYTQLQNERDLGYYGLLDETPQTIFISNNNLDSGTKFFDWYEGKVAHEVIRFGNVLNDTVTDYKISFMVDGKEWTQQGVVKGAAIKEPAEPVKEGYKFLGWYEENAEESWDFDNEKVTAPVVLYAKFQEIVSQSKPEENEDSQSEANKQEEVNNEQPDTTQTPEDQTPENQTPEDQTPENQTPEDQTLENQTPEDQTPENQIPEDQTPENQTPENQISEKQTPHIILPKKKIEKTYGQKDFLLEIYTDSDGTIQCSSSDNKVVSIDKIGRVKIKGTGKAVITIETEETDTFKSARETMEIYVKPKKVTVTKVKAQKGAIRISWKKDKRATGYEIYYSTSKKFTKSKTRKITIKKSSTTKKKISKLKKKTYYIKIRSYVKVGNEKIYSSFSKVKKVKVKT